MRFFVFTFLALAAVGVQAAPEFNLENNFATLPHHKDFPGMARFIVHNVNWTAVSYKSFENDTFGLPMASIFSAADGFMSHGTGIPYFFVTELETAVKNLVRNDNQCGLMMSLIQTGICDQKGWDAEDPRCARVFMAGKFKVLSNTTAEYDFAKKVFSERHPLFVGMPNFHKFFYAKFEIEIIRIISGTGGAHVVTLKDYFNVKG